MISFDCLRDLHLSPILVDLEKKRVFRRIGLFTTKLFKEVKGCELRSWLRFLNSIPSETVMEVTVPQQLGEDLLHLCGDHVLFYLIIVLRLQTSKLESLFQSHSGSSPMLPPERGPIAQDLRKRLDSLIGAASEVVRSRTLRGQPATSKTDARKTAHDWMAWPANECGWRADCRYRSFTRARQEGVLSQVCSSGGFWRE